MALAFFSVTAIWAEGVDKPPAQDEKLLLGFETAKEAITPSWRNDKSVTLQSVDVTEGKSALSFSKTGEKVPRETLRERRWDDGMLRTRTASVVWLSTYFTNPSRLPFPRDWSGYERLRLDVRPKSGQAVVVLWLEDEDIAPPLRRVFAVPAGEWSTLEIDLSQEIKERELDIAHMLNVLIMVREDSDPGEILFDNLRLARKTTPTKFRAVGPDPALAYEYVPPVERLKDFNPADLPPDRSPLKLGPPIIIEIRKSGFADADGKVSEAGHIFLSEGAVAAYDNQRMIVAYCNGERQTLDGGNTWSPLPRAKPAFSWVRGKPIVSTGTGWVGPDGTSRDIYVDSGANVRRFASPGCMNHYPGNRIFAAKIAFVGEKGWELQPECYVSSDCRHCSTAIAQVRLPSGRLWVAWSEIGRQSQRELNVMYSDDDGVIWKSWRKNKSGVLPESRLPENVYSNWGRIMPALAPFGKHVACFWQDKRGLVWQTFDGEAWSKLQVIDAAAAVDPMIGVKDAESPYSEAIDLGGQGPCAMGLPNGDILLTAPRLDGVLRWDGRSWTKEPVDVPPRSYLTRCGDDVLLFALVDGTGTKEARHTRIDCFRRDKDGRWSGPRQIIREDQPLGYGHATPHFHVPINSPPNFAPVIWALRGEGRIKLLRVPVE
jgi:hypothetical protein